MARIAVDNRDASTAGPAGRLAGELALPLLQDTHPDTYDALLQLTASGLQLQPCGKGASGPVRVDFGSATMRHRRRGGQMELLARAVGAGKRDRLHVVDATAGLGRDAFVLADSGCRVLMLERSALVHALLRDGLERARHRGDAGLCETVARMQLQLADAADYLPRADEVPDVVYLDPMFPRRGKSARVKKEMFIFQQLLEDAVAGPDLLEIALDCARYRVVVKRPLKASPLGERKPGHSISGKAVRYDVYGLRKLG